MSVKITYLLGAGASCQSLPMVKGVPDALEKFAQDFLPSDLNEPNAMSFFNGTGNIANKFLYTQKNDKDSFEKYHSLIQKFHKDIMWLKNESLEHSSVDTFAKKLYLKKDSNLKKLKYILSCFFLYKQTMNFDKRYDSFFASILESLTEIPSNLRVVSWNYDSQLEIAYSNFSDSTIEKTRKALNVLSKGSKIEDDSDINKFSVFKVNGTTSISHKTDGFYDILSSFKNTKESLVGSFLEIYSSPKQWKEHEPNMSFAWENSEKDSMFKLHLINSIRNTEVLVVIGYSFPFFNRKMDKLILNSMSSLSKVYVQDPNNANDIIEKIKGLIPDKKVKRLGHLGSIAFEEKTFTDQFFIPIEF